MLQPTLTQASRLVVHDVPVNVIPRRLWSEYEEPSIPLFDVTFSPFLNAFDVLRLENVKVSVVRTNVV